MLAGVMWIFSEFLGDLGTALFAGINRYPKFELVLVMFITPLVMNAIQFWVQDSFLKKDVNEERIMLSERLSSV
jgi:hypothetical protein